MKKAKKIILLGYMASGKSILGEKLAKTLKRKFIDLDDYIADCENLSISELFSQKGEAFFRGKEFKYLKELLNKDTSFILSLGGGTPIIDGAMALINEKSLSIYLKANTQTLYNRLAPETTERPLLTHITTDFLKDYISMHLSKREISYKKADITVAVDDLTTEEIVGNILKSIDVI